MGFKIQKKYFFFCLNVQIEQVNRAKFALLHHHHYQKWYLLLKYIDN